jgi:hypothetical protein
MAYKQITAKFRGTCGTCKAPIPQGAPMWWERGSPGLCDPCGTMGRNTPAPAFAARPAAPVPAAAPPRPSKRRGKASGKPRDPRCYCDPTITPGLSGTCPVCARVLSATAPVPAAVSAPQCGACARIGTNASGAPRAHRPGCPNDRPPVVTAAIPAPPAAPRTTWAELSADKRAAALLHIRQATEDNRHNVATGLIVGLVGGPWGLAAVETLVQIDTACAERGYITPEETAIRDELKRAAVKALGFNPELENGPCAPRDPRAECPHIAAAAAAKAGRNIASYQLTKRAEKEGHRCARCADYLDGLNTAKVIPMTPRPAALTDGSLPALVSGDWAELGRRVALGLLTEKDAREFGRIWVEQGAKGGK